MGAGGSAAASASFASAAARSVSSSGSAERGDRFIPASRVARAASRRDRGRDHRLETLAQMRPEVGTLPRVRKLRLEIAELGPAIETPARQLAGVGRLAEDQ